MPPKGANLLEYSEQGRDILSKFSSAPLEGFATHSVDVSISAVSYTHLTLPTTPYV